MTTKQPIERTIQKLLLPRVPATTAFLRCADLYCGDGEMAEAATKAGLEGAYAYDPGLDVDARAEYLGRFGIEPFDGITHQSVMNAPDFHVLLLRLGPDALRVPEQPPRTKIRKFESPVKHAMQFLSVRKPVGFLMVGEDLPDGLFEDVLNTISEEVVRWSYTLDHRTWGKSSAIMGVIYPNEPIRWPGEYSLTPVVSARRHASLVSGLRANVYPRLE